MEKEWVIIFAQRQPQVPPRPIVLVQRRPDLLQTAQRRGACLHSLVFYQTVFVLLLSIRIKIIFIIIIPSHAGSWLLPLQGRHLLQRSNSLLSTWWGKDFHLLQHCIDLIRLLHWDVVWIFDRSCKQDFMKAFNDTWYLSTSSYTYIVDTAVHIAGKRFLKRFKSSVESSIFDSSWYLILLNKPLPLLPGLTCDVKAGRCLGDSYNLLLARMVPRGQKSLVVMESFFFSLIWWFATESN